MKTLKTIPGQNLVLGHRGENLATRIIFSIAPWVEVYGHGTAHLLHQRKDDAEPYPVGTVQEGTQISWDVTDADTAVEGYGKYELRYYVGETMVKSSVGETFTMKALQYGSDAPDPIKGWVDHVLEKESEIYEAVNETKSNSEQAVSAAGDALNFANAAGESAKNANTAEQNASAAEKNAKASEKAAKASETAALTAQQNAERSETNAKEAENNAVEAEKVVVQAVEIAVNAKEAAEEAERQAELSRQSAENAKERASEFAGNARASELNAQTAEQNAAKSAEEAKKAAENAGGGMGGADWNAAEGEPGHVLNRTHWVEGGMVEILPECQPPYVADKLQFQITEGAPVLSVGKTYIVNWNGTEYTCVAQNAPAKYPGGVVLGDGSNTGLSGNGEPFLLVSGFESGTQQMWVLPLDGTKELTISIYTDAETIHKLPGKFLPDGVPYVEDGGMVDILPECHPEWSDDDEAFVFSPSQVPSIGSKCIVNWNGTEYSCVAQDFSSIMPGASGLGDGSMFGIDGNGEPFLLVFFEQDGMTMGLALPIDGSAELTISIKAETVKVHKVDERCMPDSVRMLVVKFEDVGDGKLVSLSHTDAQITRALAEYIPVFACIHTTSYGGDAYLTLPVYYETGNSYISDTRDGKRWGHADEYSQYYLDGDTSNRTIGNELWVKSTN